MFIRLFTFQRILILILVLLILFGALIWKCSSSLSDFGLNFTTEIVGVLITVLIVDSLIKKHEEVKNLPMRMMIYQESSLILNRFLTSFFEIYSYSVEKSPPGSVEDYLRGTYFEEALLMSDIASKARVHPPKDLATYIQGIGKDITQRAEKCLDKYSLLISPHIAKSIHECFLESPFVNQMLLLPNTINARKNLPFPDSLIYHLPPLSDKEKENIIGMYNLLNSEHKKLKRSFSDGTLRQLAQTDFIINRPPEWSYWYRISPEKLQAQIKAFNDWRASGGDKE